MSLVLRASIQDEIARARGITDRLMAQVLPEALYDRSIPERHRLVFYLGHLDAFDWNIVGRGVLGLGPLSEELDSLFAFGIDPPQGELPKDKASDWPNPFVIRRYVTQVRNNLDRLMRQIPETPLRMILEHRLMHAETLIYLIHNLPYSRRLTRMRGIESDGSSPPEQFLRRQSLIVCDRFWKCRKCLHRVLANWRIGLFYDRDPPQSMNPGAAKES